MPAINTQKKESAFWDKQKETISVADLKSLQIAKLRESVRFVAKHSGLYKQRKKLLEHNASFNSLDEFSKKIPFTTKEDLLQSELYENLCVPKKNLVEMHSSSGTSAKPVYSFLTKQDIQKSSEYLARTWYMQGVREESLFAMMASYGLFSAGLLNHYAIQQIKSFIIPVGGSSALKTLGILREFSVDSCAAVASYYPYLIAMAKQNNIRLSDLRLRHIIAGGEPFSENQRCYVEKELNAKMYDQYGLCEINTGIAGECAEKNGLHILADYVYPEIVHPASGEVLGENQEGELVLTTFYKQASPLLRYRTGDITSISYASCPCGRTMPRISRIKRRTTDTLFYKGINIEKPYIAKLIEGLQGYLNPYIWQIELNSDAGRDEAVLKIVLEQGERENALDHITAYLQRSLDFKIKTRIFTADELARLGNSKLKNFLDNRNN
ncbi:MAG: Phenylacetate-coenzyme A ligase [Candidatus Nomurabacteria bacterium GW2011_GWA1_46_11]|uniref:Phenylacetate-coenzyme A ligase n=1 Tax=Candidatus Nomurabacteria bacterium GW2011_GWA1_46_11 TaxID=1618732 RepID=A0A0G1NJI5_9BACT|nr:MAG: Phenylacetate-coenzyme A ligase [Candidatus Nomurabacteria bacterium GW2011_GWA1_46_11]